MTISQYIRLTPCCDGGSPTFFLVPSPTPTPIPGVFYYTGPMILDFYGNPVETGRCYLLEVLPATGSPNLSFTDVLNLSDLINSAQFTYVALDCLDTTEQECPCVNNPNPSYNVYQIQNCCGGNIIQVWTLIDKITEGVNLYNGFDNHPGLSEGCYTVTEVPGPVVGPPSGLQVQASNFVNDPDVNCGSEQCILYCDPCTCVQLENTGETTITVRYYDCAFDNLSINILPGEKSEKFCYTSWISFPPTASAEYFGNCLLNEDTQEFSCFGCYVLEDCEGVAESIYSLDPALALYADTEQSIMIAGSNVCWKVLTSTDPCECAVATTVVYVYNNCEACKKRKGYKLVECTTGAIIYTTTDLSAYEFVFITTDCPGCWYVEPIDYIPPTDQPVTIVGGYGSCELCNATYYELVDCSGAKDPIITIDDLSDYVGKVIKIKYCPETCWEVNTTTPQEITGTVYVEEDVYVDCPECFLTFPAQCVSFTNSLAGPVGFDYIDVYGQTEKVLVAGKSTTPKLCALFWNINNNITVNIFGECVDGQCPEPPKPRRQVTPGYNTPVCSTEYYEKVECNFSEWMYNEVLEKRYGISNCCPEDLMKWEIKHEMLMLDILLNPDYECTPITSCDCPVIGGVTLNTACPEVTNYIIERCYEPGVTEVVRIEDQYDVLGNVIVIDGQCYTVIEPTNRLVTVYWTPGIIYATCQDAGCLPKYTCTQINSCSSYALTIPGNSPYPGFINYLNCEGENTLIQINFVTSTDITFMVCGLSGQTSNTMFYQTATNPQPDPGVLVFEELSVPCGSLNECTEDNMGQYDTQEECETSCGCTKNVFEYFTDLIVQTHLTTNVPIQLLLRYFAVRGIAVDNSLICCPNCERYIIGNESVFGSYFDLVFENGEVITCCTNSSPNPLPFPPPTFAASTCNNGFTEALTELENVLGGEVYSLLAQQGFVESGSINADGSSSLPDIINMINQFILVDPSTSLYDLYNEFFTNGLIITCQPCPGYQSSGSELWISGLPRPLQSRQELCNP